MIISNTTQNNYLDEIKKKNREKRIEVRKELFEKTISKNKEERKSNITDSSVFLDISPDARQKATKTVNSPASELQKLYKKLDEYESKVDTFTKELKFTDNKHESNNLNKTIVEFNQKISEIKEKIQNLSKS
ncbi:hypothetical protein CRV01_13155 [Arcobacter sp. CECT 8983]|uniref:hypothetical protein n=1 Tax=Arcobacter sp. CECT 8983 TaxID=2044508 RepID=UPI00100ABF11|nr:hypothetical protein [Arcobacter sp. CECT 8983]RXJ88361.1 hypothetical protein CRV01_13155 [Arcobacter sp. CECT 8983]